MKMNKGQEEGGREVIVKRVRDVVRRKDPPLRGYMYITRVYGYTKKKKTRESRKLHRVQGKVFQRKAALKRRQVELGGS